MHECIICSRTTVYGNHIFTRVPINHGTGTEQKKAEKYKKFPKYNIATCACGYEEEQLHDYIEYIPIYEENESLYHIKKCICGYEAEVEHFYKLTDTCYYCNYTIPQE